MPQLNPGPRESRKISNIPKDFDLYQVFMHNFLYQNVPILCKLLTRRINTLWSKGINTFWHRKSKRKNQQYSQNLLNYTNYSRIIFCIKMSQNPNYSLLDESTLV